MAYQIPNNNLHPRSHYIELAGRMLEMPNADPSFVEAQVMFHWELDFAYFMDLMDAFEKVLYKGKGVPKMQHPPAPPRKQDVNIEN